jgi:hypothetical protein
MEFGATELTAVIFTGLFFLLMFGTGTLLSFGRRQTK